MSKANKILLLSLIIVCGAPALQAEEGDAATLNSGVLLPPLPSPTTTAPAPSQAAATAASTTPLTTEEQAAQATQQLLVRVQATQQLLAAQQQAQASPTPPPAAAPGTPAPPAASSGGIPNMVTEVDSTFGTIYDPAFQNILKRQFPLTPDQIKALREVFQTIERAKVAPIAVPTPTVSTRNVLLAPGSTPPVIKMAQGYVSSIVFLDETGQPWPIANFSVGNPQSFDIKWDSSSNIMMIQGIGLYATGNMAVRLAGLETPVMLTMVNDQQQVDYRVDLRVQGRGPHAKSPIMGGVLPSRANNALLGLLDGLAPVGAQKLTVEGGAAEAWLLHNTLYLRTRLTVLSPSWTGTVSSADGTRVYELAATPMVLVSQAGKAIELKIEGL